MMRRGVRCWTIRRSALPLLVCATMCAACRPKPQVSQAGPTYQDLIHQIEQGEYTLYEPYRHAIFVDPDQELHVREVVELFKHKEAYPWLIEALESDDPYVAKTVRIHFGSSNTPGAFTSESLREWYATHPPR